jgi:hypothetical protein
MYIIKRGDTHTHPHTHTLSYIMRRVGDGLPHSKRRKCTVPDIDNASPCTAKKTWMTQHYPVKINNIPIVILFITAVPLDCDLISLTFHNISANASPHAPTA